MKEFCKNHRKELFFVILYLAYVYVACFFLYNYISVHSSGFSHHTNIGAYPWILYIKPRWQLYVEDIMRYGIWYLQGFLLILAWISLINEKKWLCGLFTLIVWVNFYFVVIKYFHVEWWIYNNIVPIVSLMLPLLYVLGKKNQWTFGISNLAVFLTACCEEIRELWIVLEGACRAKINIFILIASVSRYAFQIFYVHLYQFIETPILLRIFHYLSIDVEKVKDIISLLNQGKHTWVFKVYKKWLKARDYGENGVWIDYYWFIRVFLLAAILILGILLSYQRYDSKGKIVSTKKKQKAS